MATFDYPNKIITLDDPGVSPVQNAVRIYSEWKESQLLSDNTKFLPAFAESVGGNPVSATESISGYVFVRNDLGWRVKPFEADGETVIDGDLFPFDPLTPLYVSTVGNFNTIIRLQVSSKALVQETGVSGLTVQESQQLDDIHGQIGRSHWLDGTAVSDGVGYQQNPFNNWASLVAAAATSGLRVVQLLGDITLDRALTG